MSNLFKYAENFLNNLDQTAQGALQKDTVQKKQVNRQQLARATTPISSEASQLTPVTYQEQIKTSETPTLSRQSSPKLSRKGSQKSLHKNQDDELIEFLNSGEKMSEAQNSNTSPVESDATEVRENRRLKHEIMQLNQEIKNLNERMRASEDDMQRSRKKMDHFHAQISESDKIVRELRSREEDLNEALKNKDAQLAIIRVRFDEVDADLKIKIKELEALKSESERILRDQSNSSDIQSQVVDTLKEKLHETETQLSRSKDAYASLQREKQLHESKLESERQMMAESLQSVEKKLNEEKARLVSISNELKAVKHENGTLKSEYEEYKAKASKTLQSKDKLIASLKEGAVASGGDSVPNLIELQELRGENEGLKEELHAKGVAIEMLRSEMLENESQASQEVENLRDQIKMVEDNLGEEKQKKELIEMDLKNCRLELTYAQEELYKQKNNLNSRLVEREKEIEKLRAQLTAKASATTTEKELEARLHSLTESLIQKQVMIEALQSEKHSLFLQLERSEKRLQDYEKIVTSNSNKPTVLKIDDDESMSSRQNAYLRESPYDHEVTKKVKRAVTEIDKFSIRLGVFLRRYPIARVFVIIYMILLHFWVLIVLFTYSPEMHDMAHDTAPGLPGHPHLRD